MLTVCSSGVSGVGSDVVPVNDGESVTLHTGVETSQQEDIKWYFEDTRIAQISGDLIHTCTDVQCEDGDERFRDRLKLDHQTGSLTIMNITNTDSGDYELKVIRSTSSSDKIFNVIVNGKSYSAVYIFKVLLMCFLIFLFFSCILIYTQYFHNFRSDKSQKMVSAIAAMVTNHSCCVAFFFFFFT